MSIVCEFRKSWQALENTVFSFWWYIVASQDRVTPQRGCLKNPGRSALEAPAGGLCRSRCLGKCALGQAVWKQVSEQMCNGSNKDRQRGVKGKVLQVVCWQGLRVKLTGTGGIPNWSK